MPNIEIDLSTLIFIGIQDGGVLFVDGDGDYDLLVVSGNKHDRGAAAHELLKAAEALSK